MVGLSTLAARVRLVLSRLVLIFALPLDFHGRVRVVRSMYLPAALHGIEASLLASDSLRKLRSSIHRVVWSRRQLLASVGAVLSLLDGPTGCDPAFCVVWFRFRLLHRYLALWPMEVGGFTVFWRWWVRVGAGGPGHGPVHLLSASAAEIGFRWDPLTIAWARPGLPLLGNLAGPVKHFKAALLDAWRNKVAVDLCGREGFRGGPLLDVQGSLQLLNSSHVREIRLCFVASWLGVNGFLLGGGREQPVPCRFCGAPDGDGHLFGECTFPPLVEIRESPEFHDLMRMDKAHWPRCLLWHGWLPMLSGVRGASPDTADASESACYMVEVARGRYSSDLLAGWGPSDGYDEVEAASSMPHHPNVWTDGSLVLDRITGISSSGAGFFAHFSEECRSGNGGVMSIVFVLRGRCILAEVSALFLGCVILAMVWVSWGAGGVAASTIC